jgi:hypothetical protein
MAESHHLDHHHDVDCSDRPDTSLDDNGDSSTSKSSDTSASELSDDCGLYGSETAEKPDDPQSNLKEYHFGYPRLAEYMARVPGRAVFHTFRGLGVHIFTTCRLK